MTEKAIGYLLITAGVLAILFAAWSVFAVFTNKAEPFAFIKPGPVVLDLQLPADPISDKKITVPVDLSKFMPIAPLTNIFIHMLLMGFVASMGAKLAGIGTNLVRPIVIKAKEAPLN